MNSSPQPEISVIIPTYNQADFLREALESLFRQTFGNWEAVVVNNFSEDDTVEVMLSFHDERLKLVNFRNHGVVGASRNEGVRHARADLLSFLDSDDTWEKEKLEKARAIFQIKGDVDLVCHDEWILRNGVKNGVLKYGPYINYDDLLFKHNCLSTSAIMVRRSCFQKVGGFSEAPQFVGVEDYDLWMRLAKNGCRIEYLHEVLGVYRIHDQSITAGIHRHCQNELNLLEAHFREWPDKSRLSLWRQRRRWAAVFRGAGHSFLKQGDHREARRYLGRALLGNPLDWKAWVLMLLTLARVKK